MPYNPIDSVATIIAGFNARLDVVEGSTPVSPPQITTPAAINSDGTPQVGELLTGVDPTGTNGFVTARRWMLGTTMLTTAQTYTPTATGAHRFEADFTGADGSVLVSSSTVTVAAATVTPTLAALTLSPTSATAGTSTTFNISGATAGSTITGTVPAGMMLNSGARTITGTPTTAGSPNVVLTETLAGAAGSPRQSTVAVTIASAPATATLGALTVSPSTATVGTAYSGNINGLTSGSSVALSGAGAAGLSIAGAVITGTPTTAGAVNIVETLAGATGSPRTSSGVVTVSAAAPAVLRSAVTQNRTYSTSFSGNTGQNRVLLRWPIVIANNMSDLCVAVPNWFTDNDGEKPGPNAWTVNGCVIEFNDAFSPVRWNNSITKEVPVDHNVDPTNSNGCISDRLAPSALGYTGGVFPRGAVGWVKMDITLPQGGKIPVTVRTRASFTGSRATYFSDTEGTQTIDTINKVGDWITTTTGGTGFNNQTGTYCPWILGTPVVDVPCVLFAGDSNPEGLFDFNAAPAGLNGVGFIQRALTNPNKDGGWVPGMNFSRSGNTIGTLIGSNTRWRECLRFVNQFYNGMGENDFPITSTNAVLATVQSNHLTLFSIVRNYANIRSVGAYQLMPRTAIPSVSITSLTASGTTVSATTATAHNLTTGMLVQILGASPTTYNSSAGVAVTVTSATTFTYVAATAPASTPATGTITVRDQFQTLANQVPYTDWLPGGKADQFRQWMRDITGTSTGPNWSLTFNSVRDAANPMYWLVDGVTPNLSTSEGSHLTATGTTAALGRSHESIAAELRTVLAAMV